jgi:hypothetical protein
LLDLLVITPMTPISPSSSAIAETGKGRASRIELLYYRRRDFLGRWKIRLAIVGLLFTVVGLVYTLSRPNWGIFVSSPGRTASAHATWNDDCSACHAVASPQGADNAFATASNASESRCNTCHGTAHHHESERPESVPRCAACHQEHQGMDHILAHVKDDACTGCHRNLDNHMKSGSTVTLPVNSLTIHDFKDHPPFRAPAVRGGLTFNHALHMKTGQTEVADSKRPWTLADIKQVAPDELYKQYSQAEWQKDRRPTAPVELACVSCHQLDTDSKGSEPRSDGAYFQPVAYDSSCRACHPLTFDKDIKDISGKPLAAPHRLQVDDLEAFLWGAYANRFLEQHPDLDTRAEKSLKALSRPLPGRPTLTEEDAHKKLARATRASREFLYQERVDQLKRYLLDGKTSCGECHHFDRAAGRPVRVQPVRQRSVQFESASFNHATHRAIDCLQCHIDARMADRAVSVSMPVIGTCQRCHAPASASGGGARHDCVECHRYHNGDHQHEGPGATRRDPRPRLDIPTLLRK